MRKTRIYQTKYPYLITTNIDTGVFYFHDSINAQILSKNIFFYTNKLNIKLYSYIIMPDHLHLIIKQSNLSDNVSKFLKGIKGYTWKEMETHKDNQLLQSMWQKSFHYKIIKNKIYFVRALKYLKNNPVKENLKEKFHSLPYYHYNKNLIINEIQCFHNHDN